MQRRLPTAVGRIHIGPGTDEQPGDCCVPVERRLVQRGQPGDAAPGVHIRPGGQVPPDNLDSPQLGSIPNRKRWRRWHGGTTGEPSGGEQRWGNQFHKNIVSLGQALGGGHSAWQQDLPCLAKRQ